MISMFEIFYQPNEHVIVLLIIEKKDIVYILITDHSSYKVSNKGLLTEYLHNVKHIDDGIWSITIFAT